MSGAAPEEGTGWDVLAGEYVLGLLDADAARSVEQRALGEPALAAAITMWQDRLDPLSDMVPQAAPSDLLWQRIANDVRQPAPPPQASRGAGWRAAAIAFMGIAAGLAAFILWSAASRQTVAPWPRAVALLSTPGTAIATLRAQVTGAGTITVVPLRHLDVAQGKQLGFWAWPSSEKAPVLLGMIAPDGGQLRFPYPPREGTPVMVTLEPAGAPQKAPGPTLYLGLLIAGPA